MIATGEDFGQMVRLEVYVSGHCFGCPEARRLAGVIAERYENVTVHVIDLDVEPDARPERVIAVPAYVLESTLIALGNPRQIDLLRQIDRAVAVGQVI